MTKPISAPDESVLRQFKLGTLPPDDVEYVKNWMLETPDAAMVLERIVARDRVTEALNETACGPHDTSGVPGLVHTASQLSPPTPEPAMPREVGGYRIVRELGRGGMGVVVEAENKFDRKHRAIKLIAPQYAAQPSIRERFLQEARAV